MGCIDFLKVEFWHGDRWEESGDAGSRMSKSVGSGNTWGTVSTSTILRGTKSELDSWGGEMEICLEKGNSFHGRLSFNKY